MQQVAEHGRIEDYAVRAHEVHRDRRREAARA
jgi:hypothetical protein